jgi:hypothetical protein
VFISIKHKVKMKDLSQTRKNIRNLQNERFKNEVGLLRPFPMTPHALVEQYLRCGNKECRCHKKGVLHGPYYCLTQHRKGRTKNIYIPKEHLEKISPLAERYKTYETSLTRIRNLNQQILGLLKEIEESAFLPPSRLNLKTKRQRKEEKRRAI